MFKKLLCAILLTITPIFLYGKNRIVDELHGLEIKIHEKNYYKENKLLGKLDRKYNSTKIILRYTITNNSKKIVKGVKGRFILNTLFGENIHSFDFEIAETINPGDIKHSWKWLYVGECLSSNTKDAHGDPKNMFYILRDSSLENVEQEVKGLKIVYAE